ncbi:hypothetical protein B481_1359 [Planococcus halocryophilus Or1]|uniref:PepSY domain-containing protein n=1 Tax=Planococcus halocryophilus TaxID=1215089 RepID=A0A1C7DV85_9BACL|nr:hypothetical protein [Planococcus halocryophilus]ANU15228.1 hypothetical protein BBI08_15810 [Planococcus halocryophilus]EMF46971.1 hypothetical protein B481_1359 [Planococcus halocryophilus Or1]
MKNSMITFLMMCLLLLSGCSVANPTITEAEARALVEQSHANSFETVDIISIRYDDGQYIVEWQNKGNCEWGIDYLDGQNGDILMGETTIC